MSNINIDGTEYDLDLLSAVAKNQLISIQFVDAEINRLNAMIAVCQTAKLNYGNALKQELASYGNVPDNIKQ